LINLQNVEVDNKEKIKAEVQFITSKFHQRHCKRFVQNQNSFFARAARAAKKKGIDIGAGKSVLHFIAVRVSHL
jgi:hypothetical protein